MKIAIGTDHRGNELKEEIIKYLNSKEYQVVDFSSNEENDDYPDIAFKLCNSMLKEKYDFGILICGTGIGMSIAANKVKGIRCAKIDSVGEASLARKHNGANVIAISSSKDLTQATSIIETFINADALNDERHVRRVSKIINYEQGAYNEL